MGDCGEILFLEYFIGLRHIFQRARREGGSGKMGKVASVAAITLFSAAGNPLSLIPLSFLQVYKTLSDSVILDWYISLYDKDRMSSCTVTYSPAAASVGGINATTNKVLDFLPRRRTFLLQSLAPNTTYQFVMECADSSGRSYATKSITFKTGSHTKKWCHEIESSVLSP